MTMDIAEAKCRKCGFTAHGSSIEEVNRTAYLFYGEIIDDDQDISQEKETFSPWDTRKRNVKNIHNCLL